MRAKRKIRQAHTLSWIRFSPLQLIIQGDTPRNIRLFAALGIGIWIDWTHPTCRLQEKAYRPATKAAAPSFPKYRCSIELLSDALLKSRMVSPAVALSSSGHSPNPINLHPLLA